MGGTLYKMMQSGVRGFSVAVGLIVTLGLVLPVLLGLWQTALPAFGILGAVGRESPSLDAWRQLFALPGFTTSLRITVTTGLASTFLALVLSVSFYAAFGGGKMPRLMRKAIAPLLAVPHAAVAVSIAFLVAPSGWVFRLLSPWATGQDFPPNVIIIHDPFGLSLILALAVKELPFLLFMTGAALRQIPVGDTLAAGRGFGYGRAAAWFRLVLPQVYPQIRLSVYAVLAFSLSVVDASIVVGPGNPPSLAVQTLRWFSDSDIAMILPAAASALLQGAIVAAAIGLWWAAERFVKWLGLAWIESGRREVWSGRLAAMLGSFGLLLIALGICSLAGLVIWSLTWRWDFPNSLPDSWTLLNWSRASREWLPALGTTFSIAAASTLAALALAVAWLEAEDRSGKPHLRFGAFVIYWPLILPQTAFMFGLHIALLKAGTGQSFLAVIWVHTLFVFPYVMLALADPWRALDKRYARAASALGRRPAEILFRVKLPILLGPLLAASAVGFAVSVAQYLPTLVIGEGRIVTLTMEAVARSSGGDRRLLAAFASLQAFLPLIIYAMAFLLPAFIYARRRGLSGERA